MRLDTDTPEVQTIGVPTGANRRFTFDMTVAVKPHGLAQMLEL
jgi:hypothetical protein